MMVPTLSSTTSPSGFQSLDRSMAPAAQAFSQKAFTSSPFRSNTLLPSFFPKQLMQTAGSWTAFRGTAWGKAMYMAARWSRPSLNSFGALTAFGQTVVQAPQPVHFPQSTYVCFFLTLTRKSPTVPSTDSTSE